MIQRWKFRQPTLHGAPSGVRDAKAARTRHEWIWPFCFILFPLFLSVFPLTAMGSCALQPLLADLPQPQGTQELPSAPSVSPSCLQCSPRGAAAVLAGAWGCLGKEARGNLYLLISAASSCAASDEPDKEPGRRGWLLACPAKEQESAGGYFTGSHCCCSVHPDDEKGVSLQAVSCAGVLRAARELLQQQNIIAHG